MQMLRPVCPWLRRSGGLSSSSEGREVREIVGSGALEQQSKATISTGISLPPNLKTPTGHKVCLQNSGSTRIIIIAQLVNLHRSPFSPIFRLYLLFSVFIPHSDTPLPPRDNSTDLSYGLDYSSKKFLLVYGFEEETSIIFRKCSHPFWGMR